MPRAALSRTLWHCASRCPVANFLLALRFPKASPQIVGDLQKKQLFEVMKTIHSFHSFLPSYHQPPPLIEPVLQRAQQPIEGPPAERQAAARGAGGHRRGAEVIVQQGQLTEVVSMCQPDVRFKVDHPILLSRKKIRSSRESRYYLLTGKVSKDV